MTTRNPNLELPPDASSIIAEVNFTTTRAGLTGQVSTIELHICANYQLYEVYVFSEANFKHGLKHD